MSALGTYGHSKAASNATHIQTGGGTMSALALYTSQFIPSSPAGVPADGLVSMLRRFGRTLFSAVYREVTA